MQVVRGVVQVADEQAALDFLVVYGSTGRGEQTEESDLDIYFEAHDLREPYDRPHAEWQVLGRPAGALLGALREGQEFAFNVVRDGLILVDGGRYREVLLAVDEEGLEPRADEAEQPEADG